MPGPGDAGWTRTRSCHLWSLTYPALPAARVIPPTMSKRTKSKPQERGYVLFDVVYEDGSRASHRRVTAAPATTPDGTSEHQTSWDVHHDHTHHGTCSHTTVQHMA